MTHLRIELNNTPEAVSSSVIAKLYELASSGTLDNSSNLAGYLLVPATYLEYIDFLCKTLLNPSGMFEGLTINASTIYISFADKEVERILKDVSITHSTTTYTFGDGIGVISGGDFTRFPILYYTWFKDNTSITSFNELALATSCVEIYALSFRNCSNLTQIDLKNVLTLGTGAFQGCSSLTSLGNTNNIKAMGATVFDGCNITGTLSLPAAESIGGLSLYRNPNLSVIDYGPNLNYLHWQGAWDCADNLKMIFRSTTPPYVDGNDSRLYNKNYTIYIPDGCKNDYIQEAHFAANESKIHFISELT